MKISSIYVENFGKLQQFSMNLSEGINTVCRENGWGKSTLAVFLKAMFYGLPATTKRALDENERKKYTPWQGGAYGGRVEFSTEKGSFRLERYFGAKESDDSFALYDARTNRESAAYSEKIGEELFGIDADGFERSAYLSQRPFSEKDGNKSISEKLSGLLDATDDLGTYDAAMEALEKRKKYYASGAKCRIATLESAISGCRRDAEQCKLMEQAMQAQIDREKQLLAERDAVRVTLNETRERLRKSGIVRERAALLEQKSKMEKELSDLKLQKEKLAENFCGVPPTEENLREAKAKFAELQIARAQEKNIQMPEGDVERLERLHQRFEKGIPSEEGFRILGANQKKLQEASIRLEEQKRLLEEENQALLRAKGLSQADLNRLRENISKWQELKAAEEKQSKKQSAGKSAAIVLLVLGGISILAGVAFSAMRIPTLIVGAGALIAGLVLFLLGKKKSIGGEELAKIEKDIRDFLTSCGVGNQADFQSAYNELIARKKQQSEKTLALQAKKEDLGKQEAGVRALAASLQKSLSAFFQNLPEKTDYSEEIITLRREAEDYLRIKKQAMQFGEQKKRAGGKISVLEAGLADFESRFCPLSMTETEFFETAGENLTEYKTVIRRIVEKTEEIKNFTAEKRLNQPESAVEHADYDAISGDEKSLHEREEQLNRQIATVQSSIERLAGDADRIPDLEAACTGLEEQLKEAKENSEILAKTQKFLEEAKTNMAAKYLGGMQENLNGLLQKLCGSGTDAAVDTDFQVRITEVGKARGLESFSRGWRDAVDFCLRLSLTEELCRGAERPMLLLDDPFVNLDDRRYRAAMSMLSGLSGQYQILYLKCREA